ncbi:MAG: hypothetical protein ACLUFN_01890 [Eubacterium sp.]
MNYYLKNETGFDLSVIQINTVNPNECIVKNTEDDVPLTELVTDSNEFDLVVKFVFDYDAVSLDDVDANSFKEKILKKLSKKVLSSFEKLMFRVDCSYHISGVFDGDIITIDSPIYFFGAFDVLDFLEMLPMEYVFPRIKLQNGSAALIAASGQNKGRFLKSSKRLALFCYGITGILKFPFQYGRIKYLSKDKVVFKKLSKFLSLSYEEQEKRLNKQLNLIDK